MKTNKTDTIRAGFFSTKDRMWTLIWCTVVALLAIWDLMFLNRPALKKVAAGFTNTLTISIMVVVFTLATGWLITTGLQYFERKRIRTGYILLTFFLNLLRSVPQIVGILFSYIAIATLVDKGFLHGNAIVFPILAFSTSLFIVVEMVDLMRDRIEHFKKLDFYNAMRVCGIAESRIINFDILWKNSRIHIFNKLISVFGSAIFLQCSVDFIISVGLSTDINPVSLPVTLGSLLAKIDSKQDILAIGNTLFNPAYLPNLFFQHLQGMTVAFLIVFSLCCINNISTGYAERHRL
jgi:ABC-type dipeptide/oligopeptide/nickel transport system permease subunit